MRSAAGGRGRGLVVAVVDALGRPVDANGLARWLSALGSHRIRGFVTVALVPDARVRTLNRTFRRVDRVTDVLSFPADELDHTPTGKVRAGQYLGDVVIATGRAHRQAQQFDHGWATEVRLLALHGLLHLIGYDHEAPSDDGAMARIERTWRRRGGLPDGLIDRALRSARDTAPVGPGEEPRHAAHRGGGENRRASGRAKTGGGTPE